MPEVPGIYQLALKPMSIFACQYFQSPIYVCCLQIKKEIIPNSADWMKMVVRQRNVWAFTFSYSLSLRLQSLFSNLLFFVRSKRYWDIFEPLLTLVTDPASAVSYLLLNPELTSKEIYNIN